MRVVLLGEHGAWLAFDAEQPRELARAKHLSCSQYREDPTGNLVAMKLTKGCGIWKKSGELISYFPSGVDLGWHGGKVWLLALKFGTSKATSGVAHTLNSLNPHSLEVESTIEVVVPTGGVNLLETCPSTSLALVSWLDQSEWGYVVVDLASRLQTLMQMSWKSPTTAPPRLSPGGLVAVSCHFERAAWWNDESDDPSEVPSPGGLRRIGTITSHDLGTDTLVHSEIFVTLAAGWMPDRPYYSEWYRIWGPVFLSEDTFKIWLPDGSEYVLRLPMNGRVVVERELGTHRAWID